MRRIIEGGWLFDYCSWRIDDARKIGEGRLPAVLWSRLFLPLPALVYRVRRPVGGVIFGFTFGAVLT